MAEKNNSNEIKTTASTARRRASLPALSRILKSQTSSFQHRACTQTKNKSSGGIKLFLVKTLFAVGAICLTSSLGIWGEPEESRKMLENMRTALRKISNERVIPDGVKNDLVDKFNKSREFVKGQVDGIPEELKAYYDKSQQYVNDFLKGKKT